MMRAPKLLAQPNRFRATTVLAALGLFTLPAVAGAAPGRPPASLPAPELSSLQAGLAQPDYAELRQFYGYRHYQRLWFAGGALSPAGSAAADLVRTAAIDGIAPAALQASAMDDALARAAAERSPEAVDAAELALSRSFAAYVRLTLQAPDGGMLYEHVSLEPQTVSPGRALEDAAEARSLDDYVGQMRWLHPLYAQLRKAWLASGERDPAREQVVATNLARIRALPAVPPGGRYVLVNVAAARLWMYEGDRPVDSMKVVVGKIDHPTPMMSGYIRYAILNPYWNVPSDFTRDKIAGKVLKQGQSYLRRAGFEVLSDWTADPTVVDPAKIDWHAVADGSLALRVRQLPGAANSMGQVKFEFPNQLGIYLHDTPQTQLMQEVARQFSSGCVRLEDAQRLGRWLFNGAMPGADATEQRIDLPQLVPVYITYLTAEPEQNGTIAMLDDPYGRDAASGRALAGEGRATVASR